MDLQTIAQQLGISLIEIDVRKNANGFVDVLNSRIYLNTSTPKPFQLQFFLDGLNLLLQYRTSIFTPPINILTLSIQGGIRHVIT